jgi:phytoene dehydrogenase-like protein
MAPSDRFEVAVIGGGHNGLVCAALLAGAGRRVVVAETAERVGGAAVTREFAPGYSVSACAHLLHLLHPRVIAELELERHGLRLAAKDLKTVALSPEGDHLSFDGGTVEGRGLATSDAAAFVRFRERMQRFAGVLAPVLAAPPPRLVSGTLRDDLALARTGMRVRLLGRRDMRELLRIGAINIYDVLNEQFESELLKGAIGFDAVLGTHLGPRSPNTVLTYLYRLTGQVDGRAGALALPRGGMGNVTAALAAAAKVRGAIIRTGAPVARVVVEESRAAGIEIEGGEVLRAPVVVSNADPKRTLLGLVGARNLETGLVRRVSNIRMRGTAAKLHLALDALPSFRGLRESALRGRLLIAPALDYLERAFDHVKYGEYSAAPAFEITIPTLHDPSLAPAGRHVLSAIVQYAPSVLKAGWEGARAGFQEQLIARLSEYAPGLADRIVAAELLTPADIEREFRMTGGHWHHGELALDQFLFVRPVTGAAQYAMPLPGLFLCGAGAHPGGGVSGLAGRNAARMILSERP